MAKTAKDVMTKKPITLFPETVFADVIKTMDKHNVKEIPIVNEKNNLVGMVTYYDILDYIKANPEEKIKHIMIMPPTVELDTELGEIAKLMVTTGVEAIPVLDDGQVVGIISDYDLSKEVVKNPKIKSLKVKEIMRPAEHVLKKEDPISSARRLMRYHGEDRIPVVDNEGKNIGLVISIDILKKFIGPKEKRNRFDRVDNQTSLLSMPVSAIMRTNIPKIGPNENVISALNKLLKSELKGVQVVDNEEKVVGIFNRWDILDQIVERKFEEGVWLNFSGLKLPMDTVEVLRNYLYSDIKKIKRAAPDTKNIDVHIKKLHGASEDKWNYEVNVSLTRESGNREFVSKGKKNECGYNLMFTLSDAMSKLTEQLEKKQRKR